MMTPKFICISLILCCVIAIKADVPLQSVVQSDIDFERVVIDDNLIGDYWVEVVDLNNDEYDDIVAIAWGSGTLAWYENPRSKFGNWQRRLIAHLPFVVAFDVAGDLNSDGQFPDLVVAHNFTIPGTGSPPAPPLSGGTASWLAHPGNNALEAGTPFERHTIADVPALHRIVYSKRLNAVVAAPLFGATAAPPVYMNEPARFQAFVAPTESLPTNPSAAWPSFDLDLPVALHSVHAFMCGPDDVPGAPQFLVGAQEGLFALDLEASFARPNLTLLSRGMLAKPYSPYTGASGVCYARVSPKSSLAQANYLPTIGPWEGIKILTPPEVQVSFAANGAHSVFASAATPLDTTTLTTQGAQAHTIACGDFDNDGTDEFLVGMRGPMKAIELFRYSEQREAFELHPLHLGANEGASGLAVADFDKDGRLDFVSTGFPGFGIDQASPEADKFVAIYWNNQLAQE
jgi:FG-GAP-like repeat